MGKYTRADRNSAENAAHYDVLQWAEGDIIAFLDQSVFNNTIGVSVRLNKDALKQIASIHEAHSQGSVTLNEANSQITQICEDANNLEEFFQSIIVAHILDDSVICKRITYSFAFGAKSVTPIKTVVGELHRPQQSCLLSKEFMQSSRLLSTAAPSEHLVAKVYNLWEITCKTKDGSEYQAYPIGLERESTYSLNERALLYNNREYSISRIQNAIDALQVKEENNLLNEYLIKE